VAWQIVPNALGELLGDPITSWEQSQRPLLGTPVGKFTHMMQRVDPKNIAALLAASAEPAEDEPKISRK